MKKLEKLAKKEEEAKKKEEKDKRKTDDLKRRISTASLSASYTPEHKRDAGEKGNMVD